MQCDSILTRDPSGRRVNSFDSSRPAAHGRRALARRRGAAVVEFALLSPILCMLLIGLFEFGRVLMIEQVIINSSREACREATLLSTNQAAIEEAALRLTDAAKLTEVTVAIDPPEVADHEPGDLITVTVTVPLHAVSWISGNWFPSGYTISNATVMRKEGFE